MAAITGSFLAGLFFARTPEKESLERGIVALSYSFFVPIFFVNIGLTVNIKLLSPNDIWIVLLVCVIAVFGKVIGAGLGSRLAGYSWIESLQLGVGMTSRGEVGLILATVGVSEGIMQSNLFSVILVMVLVTTLITPPSLRFLYSPNLNKKIPVTLQPISEKKDAA
jgi:Kef-type K+ transport system membrane component KefB